MEKCLHFFLSEDNNPQEQLCEALGYVEPALNTTRAHDSRKSSTELVFRCKLYYTADLILGISVIQQASNFNDVIQQLLQRGKEAIAKAQAAKEWFYDYKHSFQQFAKGDQFLLNNHDLYLPGFKKPQQGLGVFNVCSWVGTIVYTLDL